MRFELGRVEPELGQLSLSAGFTTHNSHTPPLELPCYRGFPADEKSAGKVEVHRGETGLIAGVPCPRVATCEFEQLIILP